MELKKIIENIEEFAPLDIQESWDCSGWQIELGKNEVKKVLLTLSITQNIIGQAKKNNCDMIISHHPIFFIPFDFNQDIAIYSAHTNLDKAEGGTTDTLIETLELSLVNSKKVGDFLRIVTLAEELGLAEFANMLKNRLKITNLRVVNNKGTEKLQKIAFCAGSGADFLSDAADFGADAIVTGDVKYHSAIESDVIIIDVGHFESERPVLTTLEKILTKLNLEVIIADEKSPFINY